MGFRVLCEVRDRTWAGYGGLEGGEWEDWVEDPLVKTYPLMRRGAHDILLCGKIDDKHTHALLTVKHAQGKVQEGLQQLITPVLGGQFNSFLLAYLYFLDRFGGKAY